MLKIGNSPYSPLTQKYGELYSLENSSLNRITTQTCTLNEIKKQNENSLYKYSQNYTVRETDLGNYGYKMYSKFRFPTKEYVISVIGTKKEIKKMSRLKTGANYIEINLVCPNSTKQIISIGSMAFIHFECKFGIRLPPYFDIDEISKVAKLLNCLKKVSYKEFSYIVCCDIAPIDGKGIGGRTLKPISLYNILYFKKYLRADIEVWGCGGIENLIDFEEYEVVNADGVQLDSVMLKHGLNYTNKLIEKYRNTYKKLLENSYKNF